MMSRLLPLAWLIAFAAAIMPFAAYEAEAFFAAFLIGVLCLAFTILKTLLPENVAPLTGAFFVPIFAFWGVALLSVAMSQIPYTSFVYFCFFSLFPITFLCSILAPKKDEFFGAIAWGAGGIFAALSLVSFVQYFAVPDALVFSRTHWPFADPNALASFLIPAFFGGAGMMLAGPKSLHRNAGVVLAVLAFGAILTTGSRGGLAAVAVSFIVFLVLSRTQLKAHKKCLYGLVAGMGVVAGLINFAVHEFAGIAGRTSQTLSGQMPLLWDRPALWASTWEIIKAHPWTGTGIGTFYLYYPEMRDGDTMSAGRMVHADPLQFWAEMGIFAPILFYVFIGFAVFLTAQAMDKLEKEDARRLKIIAPFCGLGALVLQAHVNFPFYVLPVLMLAGLLVGYWFVQVREVLGPAFPFPVIKLRFPETIKIIVILPLLGLAGGFFMLQGSNILYERGDARGQAGDIDGFVRDLNLADRMAMHKNAMALVMAARTLHTAMDDPMSKAAQGDLEKAEQLLDEAEALNPKLVIIPYTHAQLAKIADEKDLDGGGNEKDYLEAALAMNPLYFPARVELADYYSAHGEAVKAYVTLQEGVKWQYAADVPPEYYEALAREATAQGRLEVAGEAMKQLLLMQRAGAK